tara:strand:+ start:754 stop:1785 length:1032 start_codon:yes stop_codon:yes gene_type:complete
MNKLKTIGLSALAGSLAIATSANAVDYAVTGDAYVSYSSQDDNTTEAASGKGYAVDTDLYFNAAGELDNGYTVSFFLGVNTHGAFSNTSSQVTLGMGSLGTVQINNKVGSKANAIDDVMPNAMQETWDRVASASTTNPSFFGASSSKGSIDYRIPTLDLAGVSVNFAATYDPNADEDPYNASSGGVATSVPATAYVLQLSAMGLELGAGQETLDNEQGLALGEGEVNTTGYIKYAYGPISAGYQEAYADNRHGTGTTGADNEAEFWGIAYTAGDISVSYAESEYMTKAIAGGANSKTQQLESVQASYTMGSMTIMGSLSEGSNVGTTANKNYEEASVAVNFSF